MAVTKKHTPFASHKNAGETQVAAHGVGSFYTEGTQTANGEKFDAHELTAAHRTLPFGTRLRVTNVATGRSVTVRVNDRGPFVTDELWTSRIPRPKHWEWLVWVLRRLNLTSSNSSADLPWATKALQRPSADSALEIVARGADGHGAKDIREKPTEILARRCFA